MRGSIDYDMRPRTRVLLIIALLVMIVASGVIFWKYVVHSDKQEEVVNSLEDADESAISSSEDTAIDTSTLSDLKNKQKDQVGNLTIEPGTYAEDGKSRLNAKGEIEYVPGIDWSSGTVAPTDIESMLEFVARLVDRQVVSKGTYADIAMSKKDSDIEVKAEFPNAVELSKFEVPVFYFVKDGKLTINVKLTFYNLSKKTQKVVITPVTLKYNIDVLELVK